MSTRSPQAVHAIYRNGTLNLLDPLDLPEGARVQLDVHLDTPDLPRARWTAQTPAERLASLRQWADAPRPAVPALPLDAIGRDSIYD